MHCQLHVMEQSSLEARVISIALYVMHYCLSEPGCPRAHLRSSWHLEQLARTACAGPSLVLVGHPFSCTAMPRQVIAIANPSHAPTDAPARCLHVVLLCL